MRCIVHVPFQRYLREVSACTQLSHPNIVPFVGITSTPNHPFSLILDTAGHTGLREYLDKNPEADRLKLVQGIARGLEHVHDLGIVHGHLCSQNILVGPDGTPRIAGFGSSFTISRPDPWSEMDVVGFHRGSAPELIRPQKPGEPVVPITKASDMYAFGMLTWEEPLSRDLDATVVCRVLRGDRPPRPDHAKLSNKVWKMVRKCWHDVPSRRMTVREVLALIEVE
ncbi:kinase-like protein [Thelephora ganbajun]|uniref:Kinase-like protein n=1 Tax=Thelephora ganbajun TaxID=370292 RepID=A0ACB6ZKL4_THEGA|nr:kinase-like protein [Thelephora ganbajun]